MSNVPSEAFFRRDPKGAMLMFSCMVIVTLMFIVLKRDNTSSAVYKQQAEVMYGLYLQEKRRTDSVISLKDKQLDLVIHLFDSTLKAKTDAPMKRNLKRKI